MGESVRSVARVLTLLREMNKAPDIGLQALHERTGLPKATLHRMLETLRQEGYVRMAATHGAYCLTAKVRELSAGYTERMQVVALSVPILVRTTKQIKWPLAVSTIEGDKAVVRFSTMPYSPLAVQPTSYGHRLTLASTAVGLAYLAFCSALEREALLNLMDAAAPPADVLAARLQETRSNGYGLRLPERRGESATMAVPVVLDGQVLAVASLTTFGTTMKRAFIQAHLPVLKEVSEEIAGAVLQSGAIRDSA